MKKNNLTRVFRFVFTIFTLTYLTITKVINFLQKYNTVNNELKLLVDENHSLKAKEKATYIKSLNSQLSPHFLYNTLNCINWLAIDDEAFDVSEMIVTLSQILQYTVDIDDEVFFKDEHKWLCQYIDIMNLRLENKFNFTMNIEPEIFDIKVPKLFLQPIIENIFVHGFKNLKSGGEISVSGHIEEKVIVFIIKDNGCGIPEEKLNNIFKSDSKSIGIQNTNKRIKLLYGETYGLKIESVCGSGTTVEIRIKK